MPMASVLYQLYPADPCRQYLLTWQCRQIWASFECSQNLGSLSECTSAGRDVPGLQPPAVMFQGCSPMTAGPSNSTRPIYIYIYVYTLLHIYIYTYIAISQVHIHNSLLSHGPYARECAEPYLKAGISVSVLMNLPVGFGTPEIPIKIEAGLAMLLVPRHPLRPRFLIPQSFGDGMMGIRIMILMTNLLCQAPRFSSNLSCLQTVLFVCDLSFFSMSISQPCRELLVGHFDLGLGLSRDQLHDLPRLSCSVRECNGLGNKKPWPALYKGLAFKDRDGPAGCLEEGTNIPAGGRFRHDQLYLYID